MAPHGMDLGGKEAKRQAKMDRKVLVRCQESYSRIL